MFEPGSPVCQDWISSIPWAVAVASVVAAVVLCTGWFALQENAYSYGCQDLLDLCVGLSS